MAIPGLTGADYIGITVPGLARATASPVDVLGCEYMYSLRPYVHDDDWMTTHLVSYPDGKAFDRHAAR